MALDSLALALLMGLLAGFTDSTHVPLEGMVLDSMSITVTVETTETLLIGTGTGDPGIRFEPTRPLPMLTGLRTLRAASESDRFATAWGTNAPVGEELGSLSMIQIQGPGGWQIRTTVIKSLATPREEDIRWSLVHGVF